MSIPRLDGFNTSGGLEIFPELLRFSSVSASFTVAAWLKWYVLALCLYQRDKQKQHGRLG